MSGVLALILVAAALVVSPGSAMARGRLPRAADGPADHPDPPRPTRWLVPLAGAAPALVCVVLVGGAGGALFGVLLGAAAALGVRRLQRGGAAIRTDPLVLAGAWDLLAACLRAGMPVPAAVRAVAEGLPDPSGGALRSTAELLAMGADPEQAWEPAVRCADTARLARAARRSGRSGSAVAAALDTLAATSRATARDAGEARAQRAGVLVTGPLGLCFLPAFLALGVVPVVIGLASGLVEQW